MNNNSSLNILRAIALVTVLAGAVVSLELTLHAGRNNNSLLLVILFSCWVLSPFTGLLAGIVLFKRRPVSSRVMFYILALVITIASLLGYTGTFNTPTTKPAAVFLIVPFASWVLMLILIVISRGRLQKR